MRIANRMPAEVRRGLLAGGIAQSDSQQTRYRASGPRCSRSPKHWTITHSKSSPGPTAWRASACSASSSCTARPGFPRPSASDRDLGAATVMKRTDRLAADSPRLSRGPAVVNGTGGGHDEYRARRSRDEERRDLRSCGDLSHDWVLGGGRGERCREVRRRRRQGHTRQKMPRIYSASSTSNNSSETSARRTCPPNVRNVSATSRMECSMRRRARSAG